MSNALVGNIYRSIMDEVIDSSRVDFEEGGIDESVLEDLRKGWQVKLSELKIATFPWDPPPPAPAPAAAAPSVTQASTASQQAGTPSYTSAQLSTPSNVQPDWNKNVPGPQNANAQQFRPAEPLKQDPSIKQEPGLPNSMPPAASYNNATAGSVAAQRAMSQLQNAYGSRAAASISAIQGYGQGAQNGQVQRPLPSGTPGQAPSAQATTPAQYSQQMRQQAQQAQQQAQQRQQHPGQQHPGQQQPGQQRPGAPGQQNPSQQNNSAQNGFQQSQVDGAGDEDTFEGVLMRRNEKGETSEMARVDIDRMLHEQMASRAKAMEGGGFMLPLKEATKSKSLARKAGSSGPSTFAGQGFDGGLDTDVKKEEEDETIGSDLDDPNEQDVEDDDDEVDQIMLCMYDKVQRVKNKWKCTLKDGVMNVNGKDYVFHKATGEYEW